MLNFRWFTTLDNPLDQKQIECKANRLSPKLGSLYSSWAYGHIVQYIFVLGPYKWWTDKKQNGTQDCIRSWSGRSSFPNLPWITSGERADNPDPPPLSAEQLSSTYLTCFCSKVGDKTSFPHSIGVARNPRERSRRDCCFPYEMSEQMARASMGDASMKLGICFISKYRRKPTFLQEEILQLESQKDLTSFYSITLSMVKSEILKRMLDLNTYWEFLHS